MVIRTKVKNLKENIMGKELSFSQKIIFREQLLLKELMKMGYYKEDATLFIRMGE